MFSLWGRLASPDPQYSIVAEPLYQRALAIYEKGLGPDHPYMATTLENYAVLLRETQREAKATELQARAKAIRQKHAEENPD